MKSLKVILTGILSLFMSSLLAQEFNQPHGIAPSDDIENIATVREQALKMEDVRAPTCGLSAEMKTPSTIH